MGKEIGRAIGIGVSLFAFGGIGFFTGAATNTVRFAVGQALRSAGVALVLGGASAALAKTPRLGRSPVRVNTAGGEAYGHIIYGETRVFGHLVASGVSGTNNSDLHYAIAHGVTQSCGIESITDVWLDSERIADADIDGSGDVTSGKFVDGANFRFYLGTSTQTVDSTLNTGLGTNWNSTDTGRGWAYTALTFIAATDDETFREQFPNGPRQLSVLAKGCKCYDPRLDSTNGGSGSHRYATPSTWAYTNNPALIAAEYLFRPKLDGGCGFSATDIDWTTVATAATDCETDVTVPNGSGGSTTQDRYTFNGTLSTEDDCETNLAKIVNAMAGRAVYVRGEWKIHAGVWTAPTVTIDEDWLAGGGVVNTRWPVDSLYNTVKGSYLRADADYAPEFVKPYSPSAYQTTDGGQLLERIIDFTGTTNEYQAQRLAFILGRQSRYPETLELELNLRGWDLEPFQTVTVTLDELEISGTYRVTAWDPTDTSVRVVLQADDSTIWASAFADYTEKNAQGQITWTDETPPTPTGVAAVGTDNGYIVSMDMLPFDRIEAVEVHGASSSGGSFTLERASLSATFPIPGTTGTLRYFKVRTRLRENYSAWSSEVSATAGAMVEVAGSGALLADARNANQVYVSNTGSQLSVQPLTAADVGATATISVSAFTMTSGSLTPSYNSGSITGLSFSTEYRVYVDDPTLAGGAVTYSATTSKSTARANNGRVYIGTITTPADGGGGTGGGGGGGTECVAIEARLSNGSTALEAQAGDQLLVLDGHAFGLAPVLNAASAVDARCVRLTTESGITLTLSENTPVPVSAFDCLPAKSVQGELVAVIEDELRWERVVSVEDMGVRPVRRISLGGKSFAAGDQPGRYILSHNTEKP